MNKFADNIVNRRSVDASMVSRYRNLSRITDDEGVNYLETAERIDFPIRTDDIHHVVTDKDSDRLDLISYQYYGTPLLYWVIAIASDIDDPLHVPPGTALRIPSKQSLYGYKGVLL